MKQRLVGALVVIALAVIFLPMILDGPDQGEEVEITVPEPPERSFEKRVLPLDDSVPPDQESTPAAPTDTRITQPPSAVPLPSPDPVISPDPEVTDPDLQSSPEDSAADTTAPSTAQPDPGMLDDAAEEDDTVASGLTGYAVQVASFTEAEKAEGLQRELRQAGFTTFIETSTAAGSDATNYRVRVGPMLQRSEAESQRAQLALQFDLDGLIVKHP